ncbi:DNA-3-methyladenine glycosylase II [Hyphomicrobium sulfonivorans]|uniref:Putative 3-methyladenine DNA glycosylase n=1 Tax=Hyphomicrobium sulfonivorans TaxID=121290 RepID=A0A125NU30_HYPSL|nr:DNA-3-methyladenine glycosylase [Hyphomicrobium sulfonivorans]KWT65383.1 DNA-3-methyladenine glycosylase II [Hyphomicrobium sulfonivorans]
MDQLARNLTPPTAGFAPLARADLPPATIPLARFLIGKLLVRRCGEGLRVGRIVETEAYPPGDDACHARSGRTARNASLFLPHGHIYVYRAYGTSMMLNISSEAEGVGAGVLVRAVEPLSGLAIMRARRGIDDVRRLARGPGCLAQAFDVDFSLDGAIYAPANGLWLSSDGARTAIAASSRIGITRNADAPWRFFIPASRWVSGTAKLNASGV